MHVRRYKPGEEDELWQLFYDTNRIIIRRDYTQTQVERWAPDQMPADFPESLERKNPFVVEHEGKIIGFAELEPNGHIDRFYGHHLWQRSGVGKLLFQAVEQEARSLGLTLLFTEVSVTAREFFLSRGFHITFEENNLVCGTIALRYQMQKQISPT